LNNGKVLEIWIRSHSVSLIVSLKMAPSDRSYRTYWSITVSIALSRTILELSDVR